MRRVADIMDGESTVAPGAISPIPGDDHVVQRNAFSLRRGVRLFRSAVHSGKPRFGDELRSGDIADIDDSKNVVGETVEMRGDIGVASAGPPQAIDAEARNLEESDLARVLWVGFDVPHG